jgi:histidine triad (HIT) family protein
VSGGYQNGCLFCRIVAGEVPATQVAGTERVVAFRDINPRAPIHVLVIPREHYPDVAAVAADGGDVLVEMARVAADVAARAGVDGWRWVFNTGVDAGQSVFHVHGHVLAGRAMGWPPG